MSKNSTKQLSYAEAWRRIRTSTERGYFFEAVTLCESIISDRLLSYVCGVDPMSLANERTGFAKLIREWGDQVRLRLDSDGALLVLSVNEWRQDRNVVVHGLVKSRPGMPTEELAPFLDRARQAAIRGTELARAVCQWHGQQLRKA